MQTRITALLMSLSAAVSLPECVALLTLDCLLQAAECLEAFAACVTGPCGTSWLQRLQCSCGTFHDMCMLKCVKCWCIRLCFVLHHRFQALIAGAVRMGVLSCQESLKLMQYISVLPGVQQLSLLDQGYMLWCAT
jgi:hypothetical protein